MITLTKKRILILGTIGLLVAGFFTARALGGTTVGVSTITGAGTVNANLDLDSGLVGHWTMDRGDLGPLVMDTSGSGYNGNLVQTSTTTVLGRKRDALDLSGSGEYVNLGDVLDMGTSDWTASAWFKTTDTTFNLISKSLLGGASGRWAILYDSTQWLVFMDGNAVRNFTHTSSAELDDKWHLATATWDRDGNETLYIDGVSVGTPVDISADSAFDMQSTDITLIGRYQDGSGGAGYNGYDLNGSIDDVRVYNRALSASEVARLYKQAAPSYVNRTVTANPNLSSGLVGHWTFDGPDMVSNVADSSGQGNHGSLIGQTSTTTVPGRIGQGLDFDGNDDYVTNPSTTGLPTTSSDSWTISAWIKPDQYVGLSTIAGFGAQDTTGTTRYIMMFQDSIYFWGSNADWDTNVDWDIGSWQHVVFTYDGSSNLIMYKNASATSKGSGVALVDATQHIDIGFKHSGGANFDGQTDDVRIYNRALSASEITQLYHLGR